jgi:hypothetical protein
MAVSRASSVVLIWRGDGGGLVVRVLWLGIVLRLSLPWVCGEGAHPQHRIQKYCTIWRKPQEYPCFVTSTTL